MSTACAHVECHDGLLMYHVVVVVVTFAIWNPQNRQNRHSFQNHFMRGKSKLHREMMWLLFWWSHRVRLVQLYGMRMALNAIAVCPYYLDATPRCRSYGTIISCNSHVHRLCPCRVSWWSAHVPCCCCCCYICDLKSPKPAKPPFLPKPLYAR